MCVVRYVTSIKREGSTCIRRVSVFKRAFTQHYHTKRDTCKHL